MPGAKKSLEHMPDERLRWHVLKTFGALPTEERAQKMKPRDYLWCALNLILDQEEELSHLCPSCRAEAQQARCPVCGGAAADDAGENPCFDLQRFRQLERGEAQ